MFTVVCEGPTCIKVLKVILICLNRQVRKGTCTRPGNGGLPVWTLEGVGDISHSQQRNADR